MGEQENKGEEEASSLRGRGAICYMARIVNESVKEMDGYRRWGSTMIGKRVKDTAFRNRVIE